MLTEKQYLVYSFIYNYHATYGFSPSINEIASALDINSPALVEGDIKVLANARLIYCDSNEENQITLVSSQSILEQIQYLGKIAAGKPIDAVSDPLYLDLQAMLFGPNRFMLRVKGDSMIDDHICDGDYIVCEHSETAQNGMIVVALIDGTETTLKRIKKNNDGSITLLASNASYSPMNFEAHRITIQGVYLGLFRVGVGFGVSAAVFT
jgi:repressor LexA